MRKKHPSGLTACERAILARLRKGPAALYSLAWAARCKSATIKVTISRLRKKLPPCMTIPRGFYGYQTYSLETRKSEVPVATPARCKTETVEAAANPGKKSRAGMQQKSNSNNMLCVSESLPDYTLCELTLRLFRWIKNLAQATILRSWYSPPSISRLLYVPVPPPLTAFCGEVTNG